MDFRCIKCNSKLSVIKELITIKAERPIAKVETKCKRCKAINCYFLPSYFNNFQNKCESPKK